MKLKLSMLILLITLGANAQLQGTVNKVTESSKEGIATVYNDSKEVVKTAYSDTKEAVKYVTPKVEEALKELGKTLKTTSGEVWKILVKQQKVWAWSYLCVLILTIAAWIHFYYRFERRTKELDQFGKIKDGNNVITIVCFILCLGLSFTTISTFQAMLTGFINPEYGAMKTIIEVAKNIK